jgi:predicted TIM-barrel fold metal-dependent hydrolase
VNSRAGFLSGALSAAALGAFPRVLGAQSASSGANIDTHQHILPPFYLDAARASGRIADVGESPAVLGWTPQGALTRMDALGIQKAYMSISTPGVSLGDPATWAHLARSCNEYAADLARTSPGRFGVFASLPIPNVAASLTELAYAFDVLHADGIVMLSVYGDRWIGDTAFEPILAELNRRKAVVFVHPSVGNCCRTLIPNVSFSLIEYPIDTTRAIVSLLIGGSFSRFPDIRFIFSHGGGTMPMLADRVVRQTMARHDLSFSEPPLALLKKQYYDVASSISPPTLDAILAFAEPSHIFFGSDSPFVEMGYTTEGLRNAGLPAAQLAAIQRNNALQFFATGH